MEKYGVDTSSKDKTAGEGGTCPVCGGTVTTHGAVLLCANGCGSEPFEEAKDGEEKEG